MYDILQLNDMLVPELQDIAEQLNIHNYKKLEKQDLVYKILDKQAIMNAATKNEEEEGKPKRKRIIKHATSNSNEDAEVMTDKPKPVKKPEPPLDKKKVVKKPELTVLPAEEDEELHPITDEETTVPASIASLLQEEDIQAGSMDFTVPEDSAIQNQTPANQQHHRREQPND